MELLTRVYTQTVKRLDFVSVAFSRSELRGWSALGRQ